MRVSKNTVIVYAYIVLLCNPTLVNLNKKRESQTGRSSMSCWHRNELQAARGRGAAFEFAAPPMLFFSSSGCSARQTPPKASKPEIGELCVVPVR
mmetsp:Transcript_5042/g.14605  ORF Transcript_5042/g.14605 Transcript_5042/m.14605 type:complete len:95 (-) Transcript_5042:725-1009(-)